MTIDSLMAKTNHHVARLSSQSSKTRDEDSWGVKAFADDTSSGMGTTWPPRSYTCTFCKRKFRSPQALGGHMNVHRRDRACLHQITKKTLMKNSNPNPSTFNSSSSSTSRGSTLLIPTQDFLVNGGLCLLYQFRNENNHNPYNPDKNPSSAFISAFPNASYPSSVTSNDHQSSRKHILSASLNRYYPKNSIISKGGHNSHFNSEELDLELRLGHGPTTSS